MNVYFFCMNVNIKTFYHFLIYKNMLYYNTINLTFKMRSLLFIAFDKIDDELLHFRKNFYIYTSIFF